MGHAAISATSVSDHIEPKLSLAAVVVVSRIVCVVVAVLIMGNRVLSLGYYFDPFSELEKFSFVNIALCFLD